MKKGLTEIVFILDRSGSMAGLEDDTIGGFNSMLEQQRKEEGEVLISTVLFDQTCEVLHDRKDIKTLQPMTRKDYYVRGCTALLDAVGGAIHHISDVHKYGGKENRPEHTMFVITTDGMENSSTHYNIKKVQSMIEKKQKKQDWEFIFLGANIDAVKTAGGIGILEDHAVDFCADSQGMDMCYSAISQTISEVRANRPIQASWKKSLSEDHAKRAGKRI